MDQWVKTTGRLVYEPDRPGIKKKHRDTPWWLVLQLDQGISLYYRWWLMRMKGIFTHPPTWGVHCTVLDGRQPVPVQYREKWKKHQHEVIDIEYCPAIEQHWRFFTLPVRSLFLENIRNELGFGDTQLHITVGRLD